MVYIDTDKASITLRDKAINVIEQKILVTNLLNSEQEKDLSEPANCNGFGRIRHFRLRNGADWAINPLPIYPAQRALRLPFSDIMRAQVFQNAVCNWRCWYCFVDFKLLSGNRKFSDYLDCSTLLDLYQRQENPPLIIDLTGGQPDLTPEWIPWMMQELQNRHLESSVYLWSDDNLSNDYFWRYLSKEQISLISDYRMYGRVCCFKGIDEASFSHNTGANPAEYSNQFLLWERLLKTGIDLYSYITLPANSKTDFSTTIKRFFDKIQKIDENYILRIVPLKIQKFSPVISRIKDLENDLLIGQELAITAWNEELHSRFSSDALNTNITDIKTKYSK